MSLWISSPVRHLIYQGTLWEFSNLEQMCSFWQCFWLNFWITSSIPVSPSLNFFQTTLAWPTNLVTWWKHKRSVPEIWSGGFFSFSFFLFFILLTVIFKLSHTLSLTMLSVLFTCDFTFFVFLYYYRGNTEGHGLKHTTSSSVTLFTSLFQSNQNPSTPCRE